MADLIDWSLCVACICRALALLVVSNGAPVLVDKILGRRYNWPLDHGLRLSDGRRLFGNSKTWRGIVSSLCFTVAVAVYLHIEPLIGALFAILAMLGDVAASFIKRRMGKVESSRARGLDTAFESFLPAVLLNEPLTLGVPDIIAVGSVFFLIEEFLSPILYRLHLRMRPY